MAITYSDTPDADTDENTLQLASLTPTANALIIGNGSAWTAGLGATAKVIASGSTTARTLGARAAEYGSVEDFSESVSAGYVLGSGGDDSAAFTAALAVYTNVRCDPTKSYNVKDVAVAAGKTIDLNGATVSPYTGATNIFLLSGGGFYGGVANGSIADSSSVLLKTTTLSAGISTGDTSISVVSASAFAVGDIIGIVANDNDGGTPAKKRLHHTHIATIVGTTITLKDPFPFTAASSGNTVMTSAGAIRVDGRNAYRLENLNFGTVPLGISLRGVNIGSIASGQAILRGLRFNTFSLGAILVEHDVRIIHYEDIVGYGNSPGSWRSGFGIRWDERGDTTGDIGDHALSGVNFLSLQDGFYGNAAKYVFFNNSVADDCYRYGTRGENGSEFYFPQHWSSFSETNVSIALGKNNAGATGGVSVAIAGILKTSNSAPHSLTYDVEVEDTCALYLSNPTWYGTRLIRSAAGYASTNVYHRVGQERFEDGSTAAPALSFRSDPDTGFYRAGSGDVRYVSNGTATVIFSSSGLLTAFGTAAAPVYTFNTDATTGLYRVSSGIMGITCGGAYVSSFTSGGQQHIVNGSAAAPAYSFINSQGSGHYRIGSNNIGLSLAGSLAVDYSTTRTRFLLPIHFAPGSSVTPATNGDVAFELTNNTTLTIKAKGSDGTVRSATVTLA